MSVDQNRTGLPADHRIFRRRKWLESVPAVDPAERPVEVDVAGDRPDDRGADDEVQRVQRRRGSRGAGRGRPDGPGDDARAA